MEPATKRPRLIGSESAVIDWDITDVCEFLQEIGFQEEVPLFIEQQINGQALLMLDNEALLEKVGVEPIGRRLQLLQILKAKRIAQQPRQADGYKVFMDPVHGHIEFHPLCVKIIDTPQFQRLRYIKQLGGCYYVFPGASHNRFEHSLGVCHLAGRLVREIQQRQPELHINEVDVLSVMIAGLCHDLGHGPFSHMFDGIFIPKIKPNSDWKHEEASVMMFDHMIMKNNLKPVFEQYGLSDKDILFIKEQIAGPRSRDGLNIGRDVDKHFLYEVVANKRNGVDVDKWDYFARDCHHLGITNSFDHIRFMTYARVLDVGPQKQICSRDKEAPDIYEMFHTRQRLHRRAYQHKISKIIEFMLTEALLKADEHFLTEGANGRMLKISETIDDMVAYTKMTDSVILQILYSSDPKLEEARRIIQQVEKRQLYKCIGQTKPKKGKQFSKAETGLLAGEIVKIIPPQELGCHPLDAGDVLVMPISLDYGMKDENPIDRARFYMKANPTVPIQIRKEQVSHMLPEHFRDQLLYIFCKKLDQLSLDVATRCFNAWCSQRDDLEDPKGGDSMSIDMTPYKQTPQKRSSSNVSDIFPRKLDM